MIRCPAPRSAGGTHVERPAGSGHRPHGDFPMNSRFLGVMGILGSMLLFTGDMFLYGQFGSGRDFNGNIMIVARDASQAGLFIGGLLGPIGAMLYIAGFWHLYLNTRPYSRSGSWIVFISLTCMMMFGGAYHTIWTVRMLILKYSSAFVGGSNLFIDSFNGYFKALFNISLASGTIGGMALAILTVFKRSNYPRWIVAVNPAVLLLAIPLIEQAPPPFGSIIMGGSINIAFMIFFTVSVVATRNKKD